MKPKASRRLELGNRHGRCPYPEIQHCQKGNARRSVPRAAPVAPMPCPTCGAGPTVPCDCANWRAIAYHTLRAVSSFKGVP